MKSRLTIRIENTNIDVLDQKMAKAAEYVPDKANTIASN